MTRPRIVVFYGGPSENNDLSRETGKWICEYIPRARYDVTPVEVLADGTWKVPLGTLPREGTVAHVLNMLSEAIPALPPSKALERLLRTPVHALITFIRGRGGDDGSLHGLGTTLSIPVAGSPNSTCHHTSDKNVFSQLASDITFTPISYNVQQGSHPETAIDEIRDTLMPPLFVKPSTGEGSAGIERVESMNDLAASIRRCAQNTDVIVQEAIDGTEITVSLYEDARGKVHTLPPAIIRPQKSLFYDSMAKRKAGRSTIAAVSPYESPVIAHAVTIARDVYDELGCRGLVSVDMISGPKAIEVLEVNTVPTITRATPLLHQIEHAHIHPARILSGLLDPLF